MLQASPAGKKVKLKISDLPLYGRSEEIKLLKHVFKQICDPQTGFSQVALISGYSGTGKTALAKSFFVNNSEEEDNSSVVAATISSMKDAYFISGKFDQLRTAKPYSAITSAFNDLCELIIASTEKDHVLASISKAIGSKVKILMKVVTKLKDFGIVAESDDAEASYDSSVERKALLLNQLKAVFRSFMRCVCTATRPVIWFIDDLQRADASSLEIIKSITTDINAKHFLFIGAYRDNEVDESHPLSLQLKSIKDNRDVHELALGNLKVETVNRLVLDVTKLDGSVTKPLSDLIHKRTNGNIFFTLQFLEMLQEEGLLRFCFSSIKWEWDIDKIRSKTNLSTNVVELVAKRVQRLKREVQAVLKVASCLGASFDASLLCTIIQEIEMPDCKMDDLISLLREATTEGLVESVQKTGTKYKFSHDRIQQAMYSLIDEGKEQDLLHRDIGEVLWKVLPSESQTTEEDMIVFLVADQLNHGSAYLRNDITEIDLACLNMKAGRIAISVGAFVPAAKYLMAGIMLVEGDEGKWDQHYELSLNLHNAAAEMAYCNGEFTKCQTIVKEVLANGKNNRDKLRIRLIHMHSLGSQQKLLQAIYVGVETLSLLGVKIAKKPTVFNVVFSLLTTMKMLRKYSDEAILAIPTMTNEDKIMATRIMSSMMSYAGYKNQNNLFAVLSLQIVQLSLRFGMSPFSPHGYSGYGVIATTQVDIKEGYRFGKLSLDLLEKHGATVSEARVRTLTNSFLLHWQKPLHEDLDQFLRGYTIGVEEQDNEWAFLCAGGYTMSYFHCGLPLAPVEGDMRALTKQMIAYNQTLAAATIQPWWQCVLNLMGRCDDLLVLTGDAMDQNAYLREAKENNNKVSVALACLMRLILSYIFGDFELGYEMSQILRRCIEPMKAAFNYCTYLYFSGLTSVELARRRKGAKKKRDIKDAQKCMKILENFVKKGAVNCVHQIMLLQAEYMSLTRSDDETRRAYDAAIVNATRSGFLRDVAIANERAALYHKIAGNTALSSDYTTTAHDRYCEWGARPKVEALKSEHDSLLNPSSSRGFGSSNKATSRFFAISCGGDLASALEQRL